MSQASQKRNYHQILRFAEDGSPLCFCNKPSQKFISRTEKNPNRDFYKCGECKYFKWKDELPPSPSQQPAPPATQQLGPSQSGNLPSTPATPTKHTLTSFETPKTTPIKRTHAMATGSESSSEPRPTQRRNLSPGATQRRLQAIRLAQQEMEIEKKAPEQSQPPAPPKQLVKKESDVAIQTDITSDSDDDTDYGLGDFDDAVLNSVADNLDNSESSPQKTKVKAEAGTDEAMYLSTQRSSRTTSVSSAHNLGAGMLLTPPRSSMKVVEDELLRRDMPGSESPSQATRRGKQKAKEFYESLTSARRSSSPSFNERLASAIDYAATMNAPDEDDSQKTMPDNNSVSDMFKEAMSTISNQMQVISRKVEQQNIQLQRKLSASENRVRELEKRLMEMEGKTKELETENAMLSKTFRVIQNVVSQSPSSTPARD